MTTASSLWMAAAIGIAASAGQVVLVALAGGLTLLLLTGVALTKRLLPDQPTVDDEDL